eukprot:SAG31_NODE_5082_length_2754_cov_1.555556_4_plen_70_part_00
MGVQPPTWARAARRLLKFSIIRAAQNFKRSRNFKRFAHEGFVADYMYNCGPSVTNTDAVKVLSLVINWF